jgi:hypothetical protein
MVVLVICGKAGALRSARKAAWIVKAKRHLHIG